LEFKERLDWRRRRYIFIANVFVAGRVMVGVAIASTSRNLATPGDCRHPFRRDHRGCDAAQIGVCSGATFGQFDRICGVCPILSRQSLANYGMSVMTLTGLNDAKIRKILSGSTSKVRNNLKPLRERTEGARPE
jgi:hypothetical protein